MPKPWSDDQRASTPTFPTCPQVSESLQEPCWKTILRWYKIPQRHADPYFLLRPFPNVSHHISWAYVMISSPFPVVGAGCLSLWLIDRYGLHTLGPGHSEGISSEIWPCGRRGKLCVNQLNHLLIASPCSKQLNGMRGLGGTPQQTLKRCFVIWGGRMTFNSKSGGLSSQLIFNRLWRLSVGDLWNHNII